MSYNSKSKVLIRKNWSKPLLKFLHKRLRNDLIYLGLPSQHAEDIEEWIEYISEVIAFQCRDYPHPSDNTQDRSAIVALENKLMAFKRQGKIQNFNVYDGYIEEVVLEGIDNGDIKFVQNNTIRIYNLDFCNSITSSRKFIDVNGRNKTAYKFDAVKKLLEMQSKLDNNQYFVLFLTIYASFKGGEIEEFIQSNSETIAQYAELPKTERRSKILRLFVISELKDYYKTNNFVAHFLPTINYKGTNSHNLLHFTIMGSKENTGAGSVAFLQNIDDLCRDDFININTNTASPINSFSKSKTFKKFWQSEAI